MKNLKNKRVLFITTKNLDYLRNTQEIEVLKETASDVKVVGSYSKSYLKRVLSVYFNLLLTRMKSFDVVFVGDDWKGSDKWNKYEEEFNKKNTDVIYLPYTKHISSTKLREKIFG